MWSRSNDSRSLQTTEVISLLAYWSIMFWFTSVSLFEYWYDIITCSARVAQFPLVYTIASGTLFASAISLNIFGEIPSTPGDLLSFIFLSLVSILSGVITIICCMHASFSPIMFGMVGSLPVSSSVNTELKYLFKLFAMSTLFVITFPSIYLCGPTLSKVCEETCFLL